MKVVQVSTLDVAGGAEKVACSLHDSYRERGHSSRLVVGRKRGVDPDTIAIDNSARGKGLGLLRVAREALLGQQYLDYPGSHAIPEIVREPFDVLHCHNLHGGYFDLAALPRLAALASVVLTLHDMWPLTGHCAHSFACDRWRIGCGKCPDLRIPPAVHVDGTRFNWRRKQQILTALPMVVTAPSQWLLDRVRDSYLGVLPRRLIYNGVDQRVFSPGSKVAARRRIGLPEDAKIVLFSAHSGLLNRYKDGPVLVSALGHLLRENADVGKTLLLALGGRSPRPPGLEREARRAVRWILNRPNADDMLRRAGLSGFAIQLGTVRDERVIADYCRAADVLAYATKADNCPLTVLEALSCGLPVVASAVGGVPELIRHGETGLLVPPGDAGALAQALLRLLADEDLGARCSVAAAEDAQRRFDVRRQTTEYLNLYGELVDR